ncbi:transporter substrate-binding domain-containing protein [Zooshikella marina]|uniref:transporter substrate-binding domain-containing protein n=1 Tax=Zooshikella ganghwensis TaxID=202772 RepID=UPI00041A9C83|nr:transporter substrate-binding domain-containing protein [Zooshikella ganghwensis]MBU2706847.1 transporter substrate-binding domain-containing protein [Zooshikella ganghwensis]
MSKTSLSIFIAMLFSLTSMASDIVIHPRAQSHKDTRYLDLITLLRKAMDETTQTFGDYTLHAAKQVVSETKSIELLAAGTNILTVIWTSSSEEKESKLTPIRIPLRKGILGYRLILVTENTQEKLHDVESLDQLREFTVGQVKGWGDVAIYKHNQFTVATSPTYESLFQLVATDKIALFPRGINEVFNEYRAHKGRFPRIKIEEKLLLYYPWPYYFFVARENDRLAKRITSGLEKMIKNGSFDAIFNQFHQKAIEQARLSERQLFVLENPLLPARTPLQREELWLKLAVSPDGTPNESQEVTTE